MVVLDVGDVSQDVVDILTRVAAERGQSLQDFLLALVTAQASELLRQHAADVEASSFGPPA